MCLSVYVDKPDVIYLSDDDDDSSPPPRPLTPIIDPDVGVPRPALYVPPAPPAPLHPADVVPVVILDSDSDEELDYSWKDPNPRPQPKGGYKMRRWCLTIHLDTSDKDDWDAYSTEWCCKLFDMQTDKQEAVLRHYICGHEVCPKTGRLHLQVYMEYIDTKTFNTVKQHFPTAHIEPAWSQAYPDKWQDWSNPDVLVVTAGGYCMKDGLFHTRGVSSSAEGSMAPVRAAMEDIAHDPWLKPRMLLEHHTPAYMRAAKLLDKYTQECQRDAAQAKADFHSYVYVYWGEPGAGKTKLAKAHALKLIDDHRLNGYYLVWAKDKNETLWYDGYYGQQVIIYDDFDEDCMSLKKFLTTFDNYNEKRFAIKCGNVFAKPFAYFITCQRHPEDWYSGDLRISSSHNEICRRLTKIHHIIKPPPSPTGGPAVWPDAHDIDGLSGLAADDPNPRPLPTGFVFNANARLADT